MKKILLFFCFFFAIIFLLFFCFSFTESEIFSTLNDNLGEKEGQISYSELLPFFATYIFRLIFFISLFFIFTVFCYGGFLYYFNKENPEKTKTAKEWVLGGFHGLFIILFSYSILFALDSRIVSLTFKELRDVHRIKDVNVLDKEKETYYQIPLGLLIEESALSHEAKNKFYDVLDALYLVDSVRLSLYQGQGQTINYIKELSHNYPSKESSVFPVVDYKKAEFLKRESISPFSFPSQETFEVINTEEKAISYYKEEESSHLSFYEKKDELIFYNDLFSKELNTLLESKNPLEENLYNLYKAVMIKTLGETVILSYNDLLIKKTLDKDNILVTTSKENETGKEYSANWEKWINNTLYNVKFNEEEIKENDPLVFYLKEPEGSTIAKDATKIAQKELSSGIQDAGNRIGVLRKFPPPPVDSNSVLYPPVNSKNTRITSPFGLRRDPFSGRRVMHRGLDIAGPRNTPIFSAEEGEVVFAGWAGTMNSGYGKLIIIYHKATDYNKLENDVVTYYGHLEPHSFLVKKGDFVNRGQQIAGMGTTGRSTGYHIHYEVRENVSYPFRLHTGVHVNPSSFIDINLWSLNNNHYNNFPFNFSKFIFPSFAYATTREDMIREYFENKGIDPRYISEEEFIDILKEEGIEIDKKEIEVLDLNIGSKEKIFSCGMEIPLGETFELAWESIVDVLDSIDHYISEGRRFIEQQKTMNYLLKECSFSCEENYSDNENNCFLDCPIKEMEELYKEIKNTNKSIEKIKENLALLTAGYFNIKTEDICNITNKDVRTENDIYICEKEKALKITKHELIARKMMLSRYHFNNCITRQDYIENVAEEEEVLFFAPIVADKRFPRYTKTIKNGMMRTTSDLNWFCCTSKKE